MQDWLCVKCAGTAKLRVLEDGRLRPLCEKHGAGLSIVKERSGISGRPTAIMVEFSREAEIRYGHPSSIERALDGKPIFVAPDGSSAPPKDGWAPAPEDIARGYTVWGAPVEGKNAVVKRADKVRITLNDGCKLSPEGDYLFVLPDGTEVTCRGRGVPAYWDGTQVVHASH